MAIESADDLIALRSLWEDDKRRPGGTIAQEHVLALLDEVDRLREALERRLLTDAEQLEKYGRLID